MSDTVKTLKNSECVAKISYDECAVSPREDDNLFTMVCFHKRYELGDKHDMKSSNFNGWDDIEAHIREENDVAILEPLYLLDHSGITISINSFNDHWDSGQIGFIYTTKEELRKNFCLKEGEELTEEHMKLAREVLEGEMESYDKYLRGEVYKFTVYKLCKECGSEKEMIDSCHGFFTVEEAVEEAKTTMKDNSDAKEEIEEVDG